MGAKIIMLTCILGVIALLVFDSHPSSQEYQSCLNRINANYARIKNIIQERGWTSERACNAQYVQLSVDLPCVENVNNTTFTGRYVFWLTPARVEINKTLRDHNAQCWTKTLPLYELDITGKKENTE